MKILMYENGSGLSSYSSKLCEELCKINGNTIDYMTTSSNEFFDSIPSVHVLPLLKSYRQYKKNTIMWLIDRVFVSLYNCYKRNVYCKNNEYDVVNIQFTTPRLDSPFIKRLCKQKRVIYTVHDVIPPSKSFYWSKKTLKRIYKAVDSLIVHTEGNKKQLIEEFGISSEKIHVVNHGTDIEYKALKKEDCKKELGLDIDKVTILFYGSIREQKGLDVLLNSLKNMVDVQLFIAGAMPYGESFDKYDKIIGDSNINVVKRVEYIPEELTDSIFNACDVVCLPYRYFYSQSGVFMQSIKYRKPVIVSDVSSFAEYLSRYDIGFLCEPGNSFDLREKLERIVKNIKLNPDFYSLELERAALDNSWRKSAEKYQSVFRSNIND